MSNNTKLSPAARRTLEAVRGGKCFRRYTSVGNTLHGPAGASSKMLWHLSRGKMIEDHPTDSGSHCRQILTKAGIEALG